MARVRVNKVGVAHLKGVGRDMLGKVAKAIEADAKRFAPVDTGALRSQIEAEEPRGDTVRVYTRRLVPGEDPMVPIYVEFGTRAHVIEPVEKQALYWPGAAHPVAIVHHPGTRAQPYMRPALFRKRVV